MNKFIKTVILTGAITLSISTVSMAKFEDIKEDNPYAVAINSLVENKIINGYPDNTFRASAKVTRAEFAKIISTSEELTLNEKNIKTFIDFDGHWAKDYIELAASNNLLKGYEDHSFKPNKEITYGEVATILLRTLNIYEVANKNMNWPDDCMNYAAEIGLFDGIATNDMLGMNPARRDNVALMIYNKMNLENYYTSNENNNVSGDITNNEVSSGENLNDENTSKDNENVSSDNNTIINLDTKKTYIGTVEQIKKRRGDDYVIIKDFEGNELEIKINSNVQMPELNTLLLYRVTEKGKVKLKKQLSLKDVDKDYMLVEDVDNELVKIKNSTEILDLDKDEFEYSNKTYKLNKFTYYLVEMIENDDNIYVFDNVTIVEKSNLKLEEEDRLIFDAKTKIAFIIRQIEL